MHEYESIGNRTDCICGIRWCCVGAHPVGLGDWSRNKRKRVRENGETTEPVTLRSIIYIYIYIECIFYIVHSKPTWISSPASKTLINTCINTFTDAFALSLSCTLRNVFLVYFYLLIVISSLLINICTHAHTHIHTYIHTYIHIYIYTFSPSSHFLFISGLGALQYEKSHKPSTYSFFPTCLDEDQKK